MSEQDRTKEVTDLVSDILAGNTADAQEKFNDQMASRANEVLDDNRAGIATDVFNKHSVDQEIQPKIKKKKDSLVDIDQTTGRPVEEPGEGETDEDI